MSSGLQYGKDIGLGEINTKHARLQREAPNPRRMRRNRKQERKVRMGLTLRKFPLSIYVIPAAAEPHHRAQAATWAAKLATIRAGASKACIEFFLHAFFLEFGIFGCCSPLFQPSKCRSGRSASSARSLRPWLHQKCGLSRRLMPALRAE